jgi:hypothetical protein
MTFPMIASKGRVLLWSAAFVLLGAVPTLASDFTGPVVAVLDGDTIEVPCTTSALNASVSVVSTALRKAKPLATMPSTPPLTSSLGRTSPSRPTVTTSKSAPLET